MRDAARIAAAIELLETIHEKWGAGSRAPADAVLSDYYKARRYMGSKDRGKVSELVYFTLRYGGTLEWWLEQVPIESTPRKVVIAALVLQFEHSPDELETLFSGEKYAPKKLTDRERLLITALQDEPLIKDDMPNWAKYNFQDWMESRLRQRFGDDFDAEMLALNAEASVDIRTNTLKCADRGDLIMALDREHIYAAPTPHSPLGVRLQKRVPIFTSQAFKDGFFEMQDEGSQILAQLVDTAPGEKVIDFCAGAGGKTLAIAAKMENKGRLLAWDVNERRLNQIKKRLARAGVDNVLQHVLESERDSFVKRHKDSADWVLVDAPCSGSGTWRRNPDLKWRTSETDLEEVIALQKSILDSAARTVKPGGSLVYATCSLFQEENLDQVQTFLVEHPDFRVEPYDEMWNKHRLWQEGVGLCLQLSPHKDGTDGFFAAVLKRL